MFAPFFRGRLTQFESCQVIAGNVTSCECKVPDFAFTETPARLSCLPVCETVFSRHTSGAVCERTLSNHTCEPSCPHGTMSAEAFHCNTDGEWDVTPYCRESLCTACVCDDFIATCGAGVRTQPFFHTSQQSSIVIHQLNFTRSPFPQLLPFTKDARGLKDLYFDDILFTVIAPGTFAELRNLTLLRIQDSAVKFIEPGAFGGLTSLQILILHYLEYVTLPPGVFDDLTSLVSLTLTRPPLATASISLVSLPEAAFVSLTRLEVLHLRGQSSLSAFLETWNRSNWEPFSKSLLDINLDLLKFSNGMIPGFIFHFPNLRNLSMSNSRVCRIPLGTFDRLTLLHKIILQFNGVSTIQREVFSSLPNLAILDMRGNTATCFLQSNNVASCVCQDPTTVRSVNGDCLSWCPVLNTLRLHVRQGTVTADTHCDMAALGDQCRRQCAPDYCNIDADIMTATCKIDGTWSIDMACYPEPMCNPSMGNNVMTDVAISSSASVVAVATPVAVIAFLVVGALVMTLVRRQTQRKRAQHVRMELVTLLYNRALAAFQRKYGHVTRSFDAFKTSLAALEITPGDVERDRLVGTGQSGVVWLGRHRERKTGRMQNPVAIKLCENTDVEAQEQVLKEAFALHALRNPCLIQLVGIVTSQLPVLVCMEYMAGGDLKTFLRACRPSNSIVKVVLGNEDFFRVATQVSSALAFLEQRKVLHRDVAARNVLVNKDASMAKLSDLGAARDVYRTEEYTQTSTARLPIAWMAPESLRDNVYTHKSDVWSFGVLLWELTSFARTPYGALNPQEVIAEVTAGRLLAQPAACSSEMYALAARCWRPRPKDRPSFSDIYAHLAMRVLPSMMPVEEAGTGPSVNSIHWEVNRSSLRIHEEVAQDELSVVHRCEARGLNGREGVTTVTCHTLSTLTHSMQGLDLLKTVSHHHVVSLLGVCTTEPPVILLYEWMERGALDAVLAADKPDKRTQQRMMLEVALGMEYLEHRRIVHTQLRAQHCFVGQDGHVKVGGLAHCRSPMEPNQPNQPVGRLVPSKVPVIPPTALALVDHGRVRYDLGDSGASRGLPAFGGVMYEIATHGGVPYAELSDDEVVRLAEAGSLPGLVIPESVGIEIQQLMNACRSLNGSKVLDFSTIVIALQDLIGGANRWEFSRDSLTLVRELGSGQFGTVSLMAARGLVKTETATMVAVKTLLVAEGDGQTITESDREDSHTAATEFTHEIELMKRLRHPNLVALLAVCSQGGPLMMLLQYMPGGSLELWLQEGDGRTASIETMVFIAHQVALGMGALGRVGIVHRDLAARNVLIGEGLRAKVSDYGLSRDVEEGKDYYRHNTQRPLPIRWTAAEVLRTGKWTVQTDVWSYGMLLVELFTHGHSPFDDLESSQEVIRLLGEARVDPVIAAPASAPPPMKVLLHDCVRLDPAVRHTLTKSSSHTHLTIDTYYSVCVHVHVCVCVSLLIYINISIIYIYIY